MFLSQNRIKEWRQKRAMTLQQLADASGTSKSQIDKLERGERRLTVDWMMRLAKPLGCEARELLPSDTGAFAVVRFDDQVGQSLPVRGVAVDGGAQMFLSDGPIDRVPCPAVLVHVKDAYAMYVVGDSMVPMYRPRQLLYINPYKPPVPGGGVVVVLADQSVVIKEFVRQKAGGIVVRDYRPAVRDFTLAADKIVAVHTVVGALEPA